MSPFRLKILLLVVSILVGLALCEILSRVVVARGQEHLAEARVSHGGVLSLGNIIQKSDNERLIYQLVAGQEGILEGVRYRSNRQGTRGPEFDLEKPASVFRVATLGDSTMFGWRVEDEACYVRALERALNSVGDSMRYEVMNFAVPGYNTALEAECYVAKASNFAPDLTILQFDINDISLPNFVFDEVNYFSLRESYLLKLVTQAFRGGSRGQEMLQGLKEGGRRKTVSPDGTTVEFYENQREEVPERYQYMVGWEGVFAALDRLWGASQEPIVHLSMPYPLSRAFEVAPVLKGEVDDPFADYVLKAARKDSRLHYLDISRSGEAFAREHGVDLYEDLVVEFPLDLHPSAARHALIARDLYLFLVERRLLPEGSLHYELSEDVARGLWDEAARTLSDMENSD